MPAVKTKSAAKSAAKKVLGPSPEIREAAMLLRQASDPTRLQILMLLTEKEWNVTEICAELGHSQPATSHHLALMRHGRLIEARREGKNNFYGLTKIGKELADPVRMIVNRH